MLTRRTVLAGLVGAAGGSSPGIGAPPRLAFKGVNLAGAEFGNVPGRVNTDYTYPQPNLIAQYAAHGFNIIRLPFRWERLQPVPGAPLADGELALIMRVVGQAEAKGMSVVLDPHNYARRRLAADGWVREHMLGSDTLPGRLLADFWGRLAEVCHGRQNVILGLMNEPADIPVQQWLPIANAAIAAIRAAGARNLILVPGVAYSGAHSWLEHNTAMGAVHDPADHFAYEVHQYFDADSSGTSPVAVSPHVGSERIARFQDWARGRRSKAFLGEFAAADNPVSLQALRDLCETLEANSDVWLGWTAWAGGSWWPDDYMFKLDANKDGRQRAQTALLSSFAQRA
jgi:endoglucanase